MLDGAMVDQKIFVYNAARDNNLAALKVSFEIDRFSLFFSCQLFFFVCEWIVLYQWSLSFFLHFNL